MHRGRAALCSRKHLYNAGRTDSGSRSIHAGRIEAYLLVVLLFAVDAYMLIKLLLVVVVVVLNGV